MAEQAPKAAAPAAAAPAAPRDLRNDAMKRLFAKVQEEQRRLAWPDAKLCEFATQTLGPLDPYKRLKITTIEFLSRLKPLQLETLLGALAKAR